MLTNIEIDEYHKMLYNTNSCVLFFVYKYLY